MFDKVLKGAETERERGMSLVNARHYLEGGGERLYVAIFTPSEEITERKV